MIDLEYVGNKAIISYFNKKGNIAFKTYDNLNYHSYELVEDRRDQNYCNNLRNYDNSHIKKVDKTRFDKFTQAEFLRNLPQEDQDEIFSFNLPNIWFFDIETELDSTSSRNIKIYVEQAINKVNCLSLVSPDNNVYFFSCIKMTEKKVAQLENKVNSYCGHLTSKHYKVHYLYFETEFEMLDTFLSKYVPKIPLLTGWNSVEFDWQYVTRRADVIGVDITKASPTGKINRRNFNIPYHMAIVDYLNCYKKWDRKVKIKENHTLDYTAEAVLGIKKIKYKGSLQNLFLKSPYTYAYYNIIDAILVQLIHYRLKTINIQLTIASICRIPIYKSDAPVVITETLVFNELLKHNKVVTLDNFNKSRIKRLYVLNDLSFENLQKAVKKGKFESKPYNRLLKLADNVYKTEEEFTKAIKSILDDKKSFDKYFDLILSKTEKKYKGAFVKNPLIGKYFWVACFDFASLYPTTMRQFNVSIESLLEKIEKELVGSKRREAKLLNYIVCINGAIFDKKDSILKMIISEMYSRRKREKGVMLEAKTKVDEIQHLITELEKKLEKLSKEN